MIELHGWFTIREAYREEDESDAKRADAEARIAEKISELSDFNLFAQLMYQNGATNLLVNGNFNHKDGRWRQVMDLLDIVSQEAPGSYGVLHYHDDEDEFGSENQFQAIVLRKGVIYREVEDMLSPYFEAIEELSSQH